jgi:hypothetical protein
LLLGDGTVFESSIHLVLHGLQLCELIFRFGDSLFKELLFLFKQRGIRRVELQELIDVLKLLCVFLISLFTPESALERPVVSPPISTVMPFILSAMR